MVELGFGLAQSVLVGPSTFSVYSSYDWVVARLSASVCMSVCLSVCLKNEWSQSVQTRYRERSWDILQVVWFWGWKVKGQGHRITKCKNILKAIKWPEWVMHSIECPPLDYWRHAFLLWRLSSCLKNIQWRRNRGFRRFNEPGLRAPGGPE